MGGAVWEAVAYIFGTCSCGCVCLSWRSELAPTGRRLWRVDASPALAAGVRGRELPGGVEECGMVAQVLTQCLWRWMGFKCHVAGAGVKPFVLIFPICRDRGGGVVEVRQGPSAEKWGGAWLD